MAERAAIVTGASSGIGLAIARMLAEVRTRADVVHVRRVEEGIVRAPHRNAPTRVSRGGL